MIGRSVGRLGDERLISGEHVAIGEIERPLCLLLAGQEGAEGRLAIFRRPNRADPVEYARLAADEERGAGLRILVIERRVPGAALEKTGRVDEEDRDAWGIGRGEALRRPERRIAGDIGPRDPQGRLRVSGAGRHRHLLERGARHESEFHQLALEDTVEQRAGQHDDDENGDDPEEAAGGAAALGLHRQASSPSPRALQVRLGRC